MAALIGLFVGAFLGYALWQDWGAALGGIAGFFAGVKFSSMRRRRTATAGVNGPIDAIRTSGPLAGAARAQDVNAALLRRVEELERRVASLERTSMTAVAPAVAQPGTITTTPLGIPQVPEVGVLQPVFGAAPVSEASPVPSPPEVGAVAATPPAAVDHGPVLPPSPQRTHSGRG